MFLFGHSDGFSLKTVLFCFFYRVNCYFCPCILVENDTSIHKKNCVSSVLNIFDHQYWKKM
ncbi:hypothetical protein HanRHA438_Chr17g0795461 [Helianthus annuus]|nr:hypothetical protein HanIR_Chr17g0852041 [Helianthus annuus]KAJ0824722.1 hypothetical protein HanRHA438_Chr17g0795461 [Helianthus annuus]